MTPASSPARATDMTFSEHEGYLREAIRIASENVRLGRGGPFGALVVRDGRVLGRGANLVTSSNDPTAHAEMVAIRAACARLESFQLTGCAVYSSCEPCPMCLSALYWARPERIFFASGREAAAAAGFEDAHIYRELGKPPEARRLPLRRIALAEATEPFRLWGEKEDRIEY